MKRRLGEVLLDRKHLDLEALELAIKEQTVSASRLGEILLEKELVEKDPLVEALSELTRVDYVDAQSVQPEPAALARLPREAALRFAALPIRIDKNVLVTIMAEPQDLHAVNTLQFLCGQRIAPRLGFRQEIENAILAHYPLEAPEAGETDAEFLSSNKSERAQAAVREFQAELRHERTPAVRLVSQILVMAAKRNASDVHLEPVMSDLVVRFRIDGVLQEGMRVSGESMAQVISRLKIVADMDIA